MRLAESDALSNVYSQVDKNSVSVRLDIKSSKQHICSKEFNGLIDDIVLIYTKTSECPGRQGKKTSLLGLPGGAGPLISVFSGKIKVPLRLSPTASANFE
eukprot:TRINITY_DN1009_c0_g1_i2.p2 TRINITY_DN1009_c0_g1~~TRINITY_DN1009_c0_g1_i2.p2  ORF type:complete len:100 (+),score=5.29 TRINITY_DN1009_c0_g1_i2:379-678(+)